MQQPAGSSHGCKGFLLLAVCILPGTQGRPPTTWHPRSACQPKPPPSPFPCQAEAKQLDCERRAWLEGQQAREELLRREGELRAEADRLQVGGCQ